MAEVVVSRSKQKLADLAVENRDAKNKIEKEVNILLSKLSLIEKMLNDGNKRLEDVEVLMDLAYKIEDSLESWAVEVEAANMKKRRIRRILGIFFGREKDGTDSIRSLVEELPSWDDNMSPNDFRKLWELFSAVKRTLENGSRQMYDIGEHFVRDNDLNKLKKLVEEKRVVSICGAKGMGKSGLARKVYKEPEVRARFEAFASVSFTKHDQINSLLQSILNQLVTEEKKGSGDFQISGVKQRSVNNAKGGVTANQEGKTEEKECKKREAGKVKGRKVVEVSVDQEKEKGEGAEVKNVDQASKTGESENGKGRNVVEERVDPEKKKVEKEKIGKLVKKSGQQGKKIGVKGIGVEELNKSVVDKEKEKDAGAEEKNVDQVKIDEESEKEKGRKVVEESVDQEYKKVEEKNGKLEKKSGQQWSKIEEKEGIEAVSKSYVDQEEKKREEKEKCREVVKDSVIDSETKKGEEEKEIGVEAVNRSVVDEKEKSREVVKEGVDLEMKKGVEEKEKGAEAVKKRFYLEKKKRMPMRRIKKFPYQEKEKGAEAVEKRADEDTAKEEENKEKGAELVEKCADQDKEIDAESMKNSVVDEEIHKEEEKRKKGNQRVKNMNFLEWIKWSKQGYKMKKEGGEEEEQTAEAVGESLVQENEQAPKSDDQKKQLINELKNIQGKKKCFIVIDNILETSQWTEISSVFDFKDTRVLLTTPERTTIPDAVSYEEKADKVFYELKPLDEEEGWKLLKKYVFSGNRAPEKGIVPKLGKEMLRECNGLPLKISSLGRTLSKMPLKEWKKVNENIQNHLQMDDYQTQTNEKSDEDSFPDYYKLNYHKKQCFLFLSIFKGNEYIDSEDLKFLWIAEGMVSPPHPEITEQQQSTMDKAENYVQELADNLAANGRLKPLYLSNYVRELSLHYGVKEDFRLWVQDFSVGQQQPSFFFLPFFSFFFRRLVIHFNKLSSSLEKDVLYEMRVLRSLFFLNSDQECTVLPVRISNFKDDFKLLRVLHFVRCKFEDRKLPKGIDELFNLRYLGVLYCDLDELPASLTNIRNLHILNVRAYHDAKITIPNALYKMARLKHLRIPDNLSGEQSNMPRQLDKSVHEQSDKLNLDGLQDLESLDGFNADIHDVNSLYELKKLRHLVAHANSNGSLESILKFVKDDDARVQTCLHVGSKCNFTSPEGLEILEEVLMCPNLHTLTLSMVHVDEFPNCGKYASKDLTEIKIIGCKLSEDPMEALENFPNLRKLCLGYGAFVGKEMSIDDKGFPNLEYLELSCLPNLEEWRVAEGAMKKLSVMTVKRCPKLNESTFGSSLKNLQMELEQRKSFENNDEVRSFKKSHTRNDDIISLGTDFVS